MLPIRENKFADTLNRLAFWNDQHKCIRCCYLVEAASKKLLHREVQMWTNCHQWVGSIGINLEWKVVVVVNTNVVVIFSAVVIVVGIVFTIATVVFVVISSSVVIFVTKFFITATGCCCYYCCCCNCQIVLYNKNRESVNAYSLTALMFLGKRG